MEQVFLKKLLAAFVCLQCDN